MKKITKILRQSRKTENLYLSFLHRSKKILTLLFIACVCRQIGANAQIINTVAGIPYTSAYTGDGGPAIFAKLNPPIGVSVDNLGNYYIADYLDNVIRKVNAAGIITTVAGNGTAGYSGDGGAATAAQLNAPISVTADLLGNIYIADNNNNVIRKVDAGGTITTYAGNGTYGYGGDGGPATSAAVEFRGPFGLKVDVSGNLFIADQYNYRVREIDISGNIYTVAGDGTGGTSGDGGPATAAQLFAPNRVTVDPSGNLYISDIGSNRIRKVDVTGIINNFAGTGGAWAFSGDGGPATAADFWINNPGGLSSDASGNIYIADIGNQRIRMVDGAGIINTVAGNGIGGYCCDGGPATAAELNSAMEPSVDNSGNLFIADWNGRLIREVTPAIKAHPCVDTSFLTITSTSDMMGCHYFATANASSSNYIVGYEWSGAGPSVIHHNHTGTDYYAFMLGTGASAVVTVTVFLTDTNFSDTSSGPCCQVTMTQTVTCAPPPCNAFDTVHCRVFGVGGNMPDSCRFNLTANGMTLAGWTMAEYDWYILPSTTPVVVDYSSLPTDNVILTFPLGFTGDIEVVFKAVDKKGDTCTFKRIVHLDCNKGTVKKPMHQTPSDGTSTVNGLAIYPNPTDNAVTITSTSEEINMVQVIDVNGKKVGDYSFNRTMEANISLENLPPGVYLLKVNNTTTKVVTKAK